MNVEYSRPASAASMVSKVAVLSVTEPFWTHVLSTLGDIAVVTRVATQEELLWCLKEHEEFDLVLIAHWRWKVPDEVLSTWRCVGFHTMPLPLGRGGSPIQNQILRGSYESQVCAFRPTGEMDAGDVYLRQSISLKSGSIAEILDLVARLSAEMAREILLTGPTPEPQSGIHSVYERLKPSDSELCLRGLTPRQIYDRIRMVDGLDYPRAFRMEQGWVLELTDAQLQGDEVQATVIFREVRKAGTNA